MNSYGQKKLIYLLLPIFFMVLPSEVFSAARENVIVVDSRAMLLAHPLFQRFNPESGRFNGTRSEPVLGEAERNFIKADLESNLLAFARFKKEWSDKLGKLNGRDRIRMENRFLKEKAQFSQRIGEIRQRYWATASIPGVYGATEPASVITQVYQISKDIRNSLQNLKKRYNAQLVIDVASLLPARALPCKIDLVQANLLHYVNSGHAPTQQTLEWIKEARNYWFNNGNIFNPVIIGGDDKRQEAVEEMLRQSQGEN